MVRLGTADEVECGMKFKWACSVPVCACKCEKRLIRNLNPIIVHVAHTAVCWIEATTEQTKGRKASIVNGRKSMVKGQLMTYGRLFRFPETHKSQPMCAKWAKADFFVCAVTKVVPARRERRSDCKRCNVLCASKKEKKSCNFSLRNPIPQDPRIDVQMFQSNSIALRRRREPKCFFNVDDADSGTQREVSVHT